MLRTKVLSVQCRYQHTQEARDPLRKHRNKHILFIWPFFHPSVFIECLVHCFGWEQIPSYSLQSSGNKPSAQMAIKQTDREKAQTKELLGEGKACRDHAYLGGWRWDHTKGGVITVDLKGVAWAWKRTTVRRGYWARTMQALSVQVATVSFLPWSLVLTKEKSEKMG